MTMTPEMIESTLNVLADKLSVPVDKLLILLPQIGYKMIYQLIASMVIIPILCIVIYITLKTTMNNIKYKVDVEIVTSLICASVITICILIVLFLVVPSLINIPKIIFWYFKPEAWALDYILTIITAN